MFGSFLAGVRKFSPRRSELLGRTLLADCALIRARSLGRMAIIFTFVALIMADFRLHILGCGSALPTVRHLPTAQILELRGKLYLIDCGEGTQRQLRKQGLNFEAITTIFVTHLHGDHIFGLPGLLSTMSMLGRRRGISIICPRDGKRVLGGMLQLLCDWIEFDVEIKEYDDRAGQLVWQDRSVEVHSLPLVHRMPAQGYLFRERCAERHIDRASCDFYGVPLAAYPSLLKGADWADNDGTIVPNERLTRRARAPRSYAVCTDTSYLPELAEPLRGVTLLYHEATFEQKDAERARLTGHSTGQEAAQVAHDAGVGRLIVGHYSARYKTSDRILAEAQAVFPNTLAADEGMIVSIE